MLFQPTFFNGVAVLFCFGLGNVTKKTAAVGVGFLLSGTMIRNDFFTPSEPVFCVMSGGTKSKSGFDESCKKTTGFLPIGKSHCTAPNNCQIAKQPMPLNLPHLQSTLQDLAQKQVFIGTSSWKYSGWCGMLYDQNKYITRGKFAETRFERDCLAEYAEVFKSVCVDAGYYRFPDQRYVEKLMAQVPSDFLFTFKVTDEITLKRFTNLPRFGPRAGKSNENFLNADLFISAFLKPFENFKEQVGLFMFEFSKFYPSDYAHRRDFVADLDKFLSQLPKDWRYGVEIRNKYFLHPEYFSMLSSYGVSHIFNSWTEMPSIPEQIEMEDSATSEFCGARMLLKPGRKYQEAVDLFSPYDAVEEPYPEVRVAAAKLIRRVLNRDRLRALYIYVNNRLEGNALLTIMGILEMLEQDGATTKPADSGASSTSSELSQTPSSHPSQPQ